MLKTEAQMRAVRAKAVRESSIENHFIKLARKYKCKQRKLSPLDGVEGWPDRMLVWPDGRGTVDFIELKRPYGGRFERKQEEIQLGLRACGCRVETLNTKALLEEFFASRARELGVKLHKPPKRSGTLTALRKLQQEF